MLNINTRVVFDRKNETKNDKEKPALLQIEVRLSGTSKRIIISTGKKVSRNQFTYTNGNFTCKNRVDAINITSMVRGMIRKINDFAMTERCKHLEDIKQYDKEETYSSSVIRFIENEIPKRGLRLSTVKQHNVLLRKLEKFNKINTFNDCTYTNITEFEDSLRKEGLTDVSAHKKHSIFKSYLSEAVKKGLLNKNPYDTFVIKRGKSKDPVFLNDTELSNIANWTPVNSSMENVRDLFLFQCFTGLAYSDLAAFGKNDISHDGEYEIIRSNRIKTDERFVTLLLPEAKNILIKYTYKLPVISNQKYNLYLKALAQHTCINKRLTTHSARHTFAIFLFNKGVPIEVVSVSLGHTNIKQTQHYAKLLAKTTIRTLADKLL